MHVRALLGPGDLLAVGVQGAHARAALLGPDGGQERAVLELDRDAVVRRLGLGGPGVGQGVAVELGVVEGRHVAGAVGEQGGAVTVHDGVPTGVGREDRVGEGRVRRGVE